MAGLVLSLKPNEKFLVNGALLSNGPKRGQICVGDDDVHVLRMSDVIHPDEVNSPIRRVYYATQLILSGDVGAINIDSEIRSGLDALNMVFEGTPLQKKIEKAQAAVNNGRYYSVLCALKPLLKVEEELLAKPVPTMSSPAMATAMAV